MKIRLLSEGIRVDKSAERELSYEGRFPLTVHEYATTGGVTLIIDDQFYVNAPFDDWYCDRAPSSLRYDSTAGAYVICAPEGEFVARALPLPGYLTTLDHCGRPIRETAMSHTDRIRVSPIDGCAYTCRFCDLADKKYTLRPAEQIVEALGVAALDSNLPARHVLISGGTPGRRHEPYFDDVVSAVLAKTALPVDVMMTPRRDVAYADRYVAEGLHGFSLNLEVFDDEVGRRIVPEKQRLGKKTFADNIARVVAATGGKGRVRSLILVGLESEETTLQGVEFIASLGADPVLSPFRPAQGTALKHEQPPQMALLERVYRQSLEIVERHSVKLGPRCIPCQHNTLTFPDSSGAYYYS